MGSVWLQLRRFIVPEVVSFRLSQKWNLLRLASTASKTAVSSTVVGNKKKKTEESVSGGGDDLDVLSMGSDLQGKESDEGRYNLQTLKAFKFDSYPYYVEREWWKEGKRMTFWATWRMLKDVKRRQAVEKYGPDRLRLKCLKFNTILPHAVRDECAEKLHNLPKYSIPKLVLNMCQFTEMRSMLCYACSEKINFLSGKLSIVYLFSSFLDKCFFILYSISDEAEALWLIDFQSHLVGMKLWFIVIVCLFVPKVFGADEILTRVKRQESVSDDAEHTQKLRKDLNVYLFTSVDYPAMFAIIAGTCSILAIAVLFIAVGIWNMDPGKDSIIYRMTTTRMKKD
uniref:Renin receptor-like C-terminal transmembrane spanning segment domain-containing protein n=1 Tax=Syphacia muris TaxID=451379 RepID=A0A0N5AL07_9BILA